MRYWMFRALTVLVIGLVLIKPGGAEPDSSFSPPQTALYDKLTHELISPCCWREPIAIHRSEESLQMLAEVKRLVLAGRSEQEIKALYVSRYGERILANPPGHERMWLYYTPVFLFLTAVALGGWRLCSLVRSPAAPQHSASPELLARIRKETESGLI